MTEQKNNSRIGKENEAVNEWVYLCIISTDM